MKNISKRKLIFVGLVIALPLILLAAWQRQEIRGRAQASTTLFFSPPTTTSNPRVEGPGDYFSLDLMLDPGSNLVTLARIEILYDPGKIALSETSPLVVNDLVFPQILEGPIYSSGKIQIVLSVGPDLSKAISQESKVLTLNLKAVNFSDQTFISFGQDTLITSAASQDSPSENVLSTTTPAVIKIANPTPTPTHKKGRGIKGGGKPR